MNSVCRIRFARSFARSFYFEPSPDVNRVVFMATPHQGSSFASGPVGRLSSKLINLPEEETRKHQLLIRCNPGVFAEEVSDRIPTSVDLLNPHSKLLAAMGSLPAADGVCMHTIMGNRCWTLLQGKSDGIVPMSSAREPRAVSEKVVKATHSGVKSHPEAVKEILYILQAQLQQSYHHPVDPLRRVRAAGYACGTHCRRLTNRLISPAKLTSVSDLADSAGRFFAESVEKRFF